MKRLKKFKVFETDSFSSGGAYPGPNVATKLSGNMVGSGSDGRLGLGGKSTTIEGGDGDVTATGDYPRKYKRTVNRTREPDSRQRKAAIDKIDKISVLSFDEFKNKD